MPSSYSSLIGDAAELVASLMRRAAHEQAAQAVNVTDPTLEVLHELVDGFQHGTSLSHLRDHVNQLVTNQEQRADLVSRLVTTHDYARLVKFMSAREHIENKLIAAAMSDDLHEETALLLLGIISSETKSIINQIHAGATDIHDITAMLAKIDYTLQTDSRALSAKFKSTTPQGREVARRLALRLQSAVATPGSNR